MSSVSSRSGFAFSSEHELFRDTVRRFMTDTLLPGHAEWEKAGKVPPSVWRQAGALGLLCPSIDAELGGGGGDFLFDIVLMEELARAGLSGPLAGYMVHSNVVAPYIADFGTAEQKARWLPRMAAGEAIAAIGLTEPGAGSDLRGIRTRARRDGDDYVISGQKAFISNGENCHLVVLAAKLDGTPDNAVTLFLLETDRAGFSRGKGIEKIGMKAQDTCELFLDEVRLPANCLLGEEGKGMRYLSSKLAEERMFQCIRSTAIAEAAIGWTIDYTSERSIFGKTVASFQNTQFVIAKLTAETRLSRVYTDWLVAQHIAGTLNEIDAAIGKLQATELHCRVVDECLQLHGGWGYAWETQIARAYADARHNKIAGGSVEVMKMIIARDLFRKDAGGARPEDR